MNTINHINSLFNFASRNSTRSSIPFKRALLLAFCAALLGAFAFAAAMLGSGIGVGATGISDDSVWESTGQQVKELQSIYPLPPDAPVLRLDVEALIRVLNGVSTGGADGAGESAGMLSLPMPDGSFARFRLQESPMMAPALAAEHPQIKSYRGRGIDNRLLTMRCDWSPQGFYALVTDGAETVTIHPVYRSTRPSRNDRRDEGTATDDNPGARRRSGEYVSYYGRDYATIAAKARCSVKESDIVNNFAALHAARAADKLAANPVSYSVGDHLASYRIAVATTAQMGGDINSVINWISGVNLIYERELSIHLDLVTNSRLLGSASLSDGDPDLMVDQARQFLRSNLSDGDYDLGHVLGRGNGGKAYIGAACSTGFDGAGPYKAGGATLVNGYPGNPADVLSLAHEIGHQFGARHSFNANTGNCNQTRFSASAYESGSGLTIMSLAGACGPNAIAPGREARFHAGSLEEIMTYLSFIGGGTVDGTGNSVPAVNGGADYVIPGNTPFKLTAAGSDADSDALTYVWEQMDAGGGAYLNPAYSDAGDPPDTTRPIFRPFSPSIDPARTFPSLNCILNDANAPPATDSGGFQTAENLPNVTRAINFQVTVRDNRGAGGGASSDAVRIEVDGERGPFAVTAPNSSTTWPGGSPQTVTWSVNGTESLAANVKITLSTDGGTTFPHILAESAPNNGGKEIIVPSLDTQSARIRIEAIGNVFFDISDADFTITAGAICTYTINPASQNFAASGGVGTVDVTAGPGCAWTATSGVTWITIVAGASCEGNGTVGYFVAANTGGQRTGTITITGITGQTVTVMHTVTQTAGLQYYPLPFPVRLLDTRPDPFTSCFPSSTPLTGGGVLTLPAVGNCSGATIPASAKAVVGNATVVNFISTGGYITLFPSDAAQPNASNLNFTANHVVPNSFTVGLGGDGAFKIFASASTNFIVDITGYYAPPGAGGLYFHPLPFPVRTLDTRPDPFTSCVSSSTPLVGGGTLTLPVAGNCNGLTIPASAKAVVGNATVVNSQSSGGYITLFPEGTAPNASNLNFTANHIVPNSFVVGLSAAGSFNIFASASTDFIVDIAGYFSDQAVDVNGQGLLFYPLLAPARWLDTRPDPFVSCIPSSAPLGAGSVSTLQAQLTCEGQTIPASAKSVLGNATVVNFISGGGFITLFPSNASQPNASNLNFTANHTVPNSFVVSLGADGAFKIFTSAATNFIVDLSGYFAP